MVQKQQNWRTGDGFKAFYEIKINRSQYQGEVTGGGTDFKTGSKRNFATISFVPERESDAEPEPKKRWRASWHQGWGGREKFPHRPSTRR